MLFRIRSLTVTWLAVLAVGSVAWSQGVASRPIQFSGPKKESSDDTTLNPNQSRLGMLENELNRPFQNITPGRSLDGVMLNTPLPAPPPATRNSRDRNMNNKRWEWMYRSSEEMMSVESIEDRYKQPELTPDGRDRSKLRPMERAYFDAMHSGAATNQFGAGPNAAYNSSLPGAFGGTALGTSPDSFNSVESMWQRSMQTSSGVTAPRTTDATDFSAFGRNSGSPTRPTDAQIRRAEQFMEIYNFSGTPMPESSPGSSHIYISPYVNRSFFDLSKPQPTTAAPALSSSVGSASLGMPGPAPGIPSYSPPASGPSRSAAPASPFMNVTRGGF
jgi:hypothetical protein